MFFIRIDRPEIAATLYGANTRHAVSLGSWTCRSSWTISAMSWARANSTSCLATGAAMELAAVVQYARRHIELARPPATRSAPTASAFRTAVSTTNRPHSYDIRAPTIPASTPPIHGSSPRVGRWYTRRRNGGVEAVSTVPGGVMRRSHTRARSSAKRLADIDAAIHDRKCCDAADRIGATNR